MTVRSNSELESNMGWSVIVELIMLCVSYEILTDNFSLQAMNNDTKPYFLRQISWVPKLNIDVDHPKCLKLANKVCKRLLRGTCSTQWVKDLSLSEAYEYAVTFYSFNLKVPPGFDQHTSLLISKSMKVGQKRQTQSLLHQVETEVKLKFDRQKEVSWHERLLSLLWTNKKDKAKEDYYLSQKDLDQEPLRGQIRIRSKISFKLK